MNQNFPLVERLQAVESRIKRIQKDISASTKMHELDIYANMLRDEFDKVRAIRSDPDFLRQEQTQLAFQKIAELEKKLVGPAKPEAQELGLKIDVSGVEQAIEALNRLEAAAIAAQKAVGAVGYAQQVHSGEAVLPSIARMERTLAKWDADGVPTRKE
jgi:predicted  nucleic acid-binding Zn-ribbon protein